MAIKRHNGLVVKPNVLDAHTGNLLLKVVPVLFSFIFFYDINNGHAHMYMYACFPSHSQSVQTFELIPVVYLLAVKELAGYQAIAIGY